MDITHHPNSIPVPFCSRIRTTGGVRFPPDGLGIPIASKPVALSAPNDILDLELNTDACRFAFRSLTTQGGVTFTPNAHCSSLVQDLEELDPLFPPYTLRLHSTHIERSCVVRSVIMGLVRLQKHIPYKSCAATAVESNRSSFIILAK